MNMRNERATTQHKSIYNEHQDTDTSNPKATKSSIRHYFGKTQPSQHQATAALAKLTNIRPIAKPPSRNANPLSPPSWNHHEQWQSQT